MKSLFFFLYHSVSVLSAIDLLYGGIYCFMCQDYIYDKDMEQIAKEEQRKAWKMQGMAASNTHSHVHTVARTSCQVMSLVLKRNYTQTWNFLSNIKREKQRAKNGALGLSIFHIRIY